MENFSDMADKIAAVDPVAEAEKLTGLTVLNDDFTAEQAVKGLVEQRMIVRELRQKSNDSFFHCPAFVMMDVLSGLGAECVLVENIVSSQTSHNEIFQVWAHPSEKWFVSFDTFTMDEEDTLVVNSAYLYCNFVLDFYEKDDWRSVVKGFKGSVERDCRDGRNVLCAYFDARDGLASRVKKMRDFSEGSFCSDWTLGFDDFAVSHFADVETENRSCLLNRKLKLPSWILDALTANNVVSYHDLLDEGDVRENG